MNQQVFGRHKSLIDKAWKTSPKQVLENPESLSKTPVRFSKIKRTSNELTYTL